jgi:hypothetical protein
LAIVNNRRLVFHNIGLYGSLTNSFCTRHAVAAFAEMTLAAAFITITASGPTIAAFVHAPLVATTLTLHSQDVTVVASIIATFTVSATSASTI